MWRARQAELGECRVLDPGTLSFTETKLVGPHRIEVTQGACPSLEDRTKKQGSLLGLEFVGIDAWESDLPFSQPKGESAG